MLSGADLQKNAMAEQGVPGSMPVVTKSALDMRVRV